MAYFVTSVEIKLYLKLIKHIPPLLLTPKKSGQNLADFSGNCLEHVTVADDASWSILKLTFLQRPKQNIMKNQTSH